MHTRKSIPLKAGKSFFLTQELKKACNKVFYYVEKVVFDKNVF